LTLTALGIIVPSLASFLKEYLKDHLPGGIHDQLEANEVAGVPKHNKFCERLFGYFDNLLRRKPNLSTLTAEAFTMFAMNKTGDWLKGLGEAERNNIIREAQKDSKELKKKYNERQEDILKTRRANLEKERVEKERKKRARAEEIRTLSVELEALGRLWESDQAVEEGLNRLKTGKRGEVKNQLEAIKVQMSYRRKVLLQKVKDTKLWNFRRVPRSGRPC
jgi:hypothetical protein